MAVKVAFFTDTYYPQVNGLVTSIATAKADLERMGNEAEIYAPYLGPWADGPDIFRLKGFVYIPQPEYTFVLPWGRGFRLSRLRPNGVQIIHSHAMFGSGFVALYCAWRQKLPLLMTYHTLFEDYVHYFPYLPAPFVRWANKVLTRWMCNRCTLVIAPTPAIRDVLRSYGVEHRIEVLPTGLDAQVFVKSGVHKSKYGAADHELLLSCAGRTGREKNMDLLIDALAKIAPEVPPFKLVIAGDGPERARLEQRVKDRGLAGRVVILGYIPRADVLDLMEASDLFVFPSVTETQGMVVIEAMGRGTPVLGADALGVGWMMKQGAAPGEARGGWLAKADDGEDYAAKLKMVMNDPAARAAKAAETTAMALEYQSEVLNKTLAGYYEEMLRDPKNL
ncbi:MAG TPA: glycosyltransferase [bacterium]|jgi:1,2-diacylglycerol 3-alpha-glucosyltransferase|nr:glycosyltransferase [bacterium]